MNKTSIPLFTHDLTVALDHLGTSAIEYGTEIHNVFVGLRENDAVPTKALARSPLVRARACQLAIAAIAYTIQVAIELDCDVAQMRALEARLIAVHPEEVTS